MSEDENMKAELEHLRAENERLKQGSAGRKEISLKVSQKGAVSVYGLGRFPVTLYREQWQRLLDKREDILQFITDNADQLKTKE
jgi:hypothetical protein